MNELCVEVGHPNGAYYKVSLKKRLFRKEKKQNRKYFRLMFTMWMQLAWKSKTIKSKFIVFFCYCKCLFSLSFKFLPSDKNPIFRSPCSITTRIERSQKIDIWRSMRGFYYYKNNLFL